MKVEVKPVDQHQVSLLIEVPADAVNQGIQSAVQRISNQVTIPGFRKGKTPRKILEAHFGKDAIMAEASDLIVNKYYDEALREQNLVPVTRADVDVEQFEEGKDMKFKVTFIKKPEVKLGDYKELNVEHKHQKVTDKMVDEQLEAIAKQHAKLTVAEGAELANGDLAMIDFKGSIDGKPFDGGEGKSYPLEIGSGSFIPGFEEQLIGHKAGDEVTVKVQFPKEYFVQELAGKDAEFAVNVLDVKRREMPELNDEFAKTASSFETLAELKAMVRQQMQENIDNHDREEFQNKLIKTAVDNAETDIPNAMVEGRIDQMIEELKLNLESRNMKFEDYLEQSKNSLDKLRENYREAALVNVKTDLVLEAVCQAEDIHVTPEDMNMEVYQMAQNFGADPKDVWGIIQKEGRISMLAGTVARRKAAAFIINNAKHDHDEVAEKEEKAKPSDAEAAKEEKPAKKAGAKKAAAKKVAKDADNEEKDAEKAEK